MLWILVVVALGLLLVPTRYRKAAVAVVGALLGAFLILVIVNRRPAPDSRDVGPAPTAPVSRRFDFDRYERDKKDRDDPDAKSRIALSEVRFGQISAIPGLDVGTLQSIRARLYNDSVQFALTDYDYYLLIQDCLPGVSAPACTTVYDQRGTVSLIVPAGQARDVVIVIPRSAVNPTVPFKLLGTPRVELSAAEVRSYRTAPP